MVIFFLHLEEHRERAPILAAATAGAPAASGGCTGSCCWRSRRRRRNSGRGRGRRGRLRVSSRSGGPGILTQLRSHGQQRRQTSSCLVLLLLLLLLLLLVVLLPRRQHALALVVGLQRRLVLAAECQLVHGRSGRLRLDLPSSAALRALHRLSPVAAGLVPVHSAVLLLLLLLQVVVELLLLVLLHGGGRVKVAPAEGVGRIVAALHRIRGGGRVRRRALEY